MLKLFPTRVRCAEAGHQAPHVQAPGSHQARGDATRWAGRGIENSLLHISAVSCCSMCECGRGRLQLTAARSDHCSVDRLALLGSLQSAGLTSQLQFTATASGCMCCSNTFVRFPAKFSYFCDSRSGSNWILLYCARRRWGYQHWRQN